jgi:hypothetical protein
LYSWLGGPPPLSFCVKRRAYMRIAILVLLSAALVMGCRSTVQADGSYDTNAIRGRIVSGLPPGWSLLPHQDDTQRRFTSSYFTDPQTDSFILVGTQPNYIDWTDKEGLPHREYLAKECLYVSVMPASFQPKFQRGFKVGPPLPLVYKSEAVRMYAWVSHYVADTNRTDDILKQATLISSPEVHLSWKRWRKDLATALKK